MFTIESVIRDARRVPPLARGGLAVLVMGVVVDLVAHVATLGQAGPGHHHAFSPGEVVGHLVLLVGMVLILAGVVVDGVRRSHPGGPTGERSTGGS